MMEMLEWLGRKTLGIFNQLGAIILLFVAAVKQLPKISFHETAKQSLDLGVKSFSIVALTLLFTGMVLSVQMAGVLTKYGAAFSIGGIVTIAMGRELGPVLCGVVLAARPLRLNWGPCGLRNRLMLFAVWQSILWPIWWCPEWWPV